MIKSILLLLLAHQYSYCEILRKEIRRYSLNFFYLNNYINKT